MLETVLDTHQPLPPPRRLPGMELLPPTLDQEGLFRRFMREFAAEERVDFTDLAGNPLIIDRHLFLDLKGAWKIQKGERAAWLLYTATNIRQPDEIWFEPGRRGGQDKLYYFSRFEVSRRGLLSCIAVFGREQGAEGFWLGRTNYATTQVGYVERKRNKEIIAGQLRHSRRE